jgi:glycosyltransferase
MIADEFQMKEIDCIYADVEYVDKLNTDKVIRNAKSRMFTPGLFKTGWHPDHSTFYVKRQIYEEYGYLNTKFEIAADYELMLRFLERYKIKSYYIPVVLVRMRIGGASNGSIRNIIKGNFECYKSWKINNMKMSMFIIVKKLYLKILQLIK